MLIRAIRQAKPEGEGIMVSLAAREWIAEGKAQGVVQGKADMLLRLLRRRFGALVPEIEHRVRDADNARLDAWSERILDARAIDDVFGADIFGADRPN